METYPNNLKPLYYRIYEDFMDKINVGALVPGDMIPNEQELCSSYGVSRVTVRKAILSLVDEGLITRVKGVGSFVSKPAEQSNNRQENTTIGVIFENALGSFLADVTHGIEQVTSDNNCHLNISISNKSFEKERDSLEKMRDNSVSGIIIMPTGSDDPQNPNCDIYLELDNSGIPIIQIDRYLKNLPLSYVVASDFQGLYDITDYLVSLGHEKIGMIKSREFVSSTTNRIEGFKHCLMDRQKVIYSIYLLDCFSYLEIQSSIDNGYETMKRYLKSTDDLPTVFVCTSDDS